MEAEDLLKRICSSGTVEDLKEAISKGCDFSHVSLYFICIRNEVDILKVLLENGAKDFYGGLVGSCQIGNIDIVKLMISHGANQFNEGLKNACYGGNIEIVKLMISHGADDWNGGLLCAVRKGYKEIVKLLLSKNIDNLDNILDNILTLACFHEHIDIVKLIVEKGCNFNWDAALKSAYGNTEIMTFLILSARTIPSWCELSQEQLYLFYKSGIRSVKYKFYFDYLEKIDYQTFLVCEDILIRDISSVILSY